MIVVTYLLDFVTVGADCVVVAVMVMGFITRNIAVDWSDFMDESELFKEFHGSIDGGDIDGVVTDFCDVVGVERFGWLGNDVNDNLTWFCYLVSVLGEGGVYCGLKHNGELLMINYQ